MSEETMGFQTSQQPLLSLENDMSITERWVHLHAIELVAPEQCLEGFESQVDFFHQIRSSL